MNTPTLHILLADDDKDDRLFFKEALEQLPFSTHLTEFYFGDQLMQWLMKQTDDLPDALFLDLNMPRKSGFQCLSEIKHNEMLKHLPILILSTSLEIKIADILYKEGAQFYIRKPTSFLQLTQVLSEAITFIAKKDFGQPPRDKFVLSGDFNKQI